MSKNNIIIGQIGNIGNYYGGLFIKKHNGKYFWGICDFTDKVDKWEEIPKSLYTEILKFNDANR